MALLIFGIILIALGGGMYYSRNRNQSKVMDMKYYETSKVSDVVDTYQQIRDELGQGNYSGNIVELSGVAHSDSPLTGEHSGKSAVYYEASVVREYEVEEEEKNKDGNMRTVMRRKSEVISKDTQQVPLYLDDNTGAKILIDIKGAKLDLVQSFDRRDQEPPASLNRTYEAPGSRTLGYRYEEKMIPLGAKLYVLGEVSDKKGELAVVKPTDTKKAFRVSTRSEAEIIQSVESSAKWLQIGAIASALIGLGLILTYFLR